MSDKKEKKEKNEKVENKANNEDWLKQLLFEQLAKTKKKMEKDKEEGKTEDDQDYSKAFRLFKKKPDQEQQTEKINEKTSQDQQVNEEEEQQISEALKEALDKKPDPKKIAEQEQIEKTTEQIRNAFAQQENCKEIKDEAQEKKIDQVMKEAFGHLKEFQQEQQEKKLKSKQVQQQPKEQVKEPLYNLKSLIKFRQDLHMYPETAGNEKTIQKHIYQYLQSSLKIPQSSIQTMGKTGLLLDITGRKESKGQNRGIILRAAIDAMRKKESVTDSQQCGFWNGNDGVVACLLGGVAKILENIESIPSNLTIRFLFQPASENSEGARQMIQEKCLQNMNEIYGMGVFKSSIPAIQFLCLSDKKEGYNVLKVAQEVFGKPNTVNSLDPNPYRIKILSSNDDFNEYQKTLPGAKFYVGCKTKNLFSYGIYEDDKDKEEMFDFNDDIIEPMSNFWLKLIKSRW